MVARPLGAAAAAAATAALPRLNGSDALLPRAVVSRLARLDVRRSQPSHQPLPLQRAALHELRAVEREPQLELGGVGRVQLALEDVHVRLLLLCGSVVVVLGIQRPDVARRASSHVSFLALRTHSDRGLRQPVRGATGCLDGRKEFIPETIINLCKLRKFINKLIIINLYAGSWAANFLPLLRLCRTQRGAKAKRGRACLSRCASGRVRSTFARRR